MRLLFKITLLLLLFFTLTFDLTGQSTFEMFTLADPFNRATSLCLGDLDNDGDLDIIAGSGGQGLKWYENIGGNPANYNSHSLDSGIKKVFTVICGDLDQDGNMDIIAGSWDDNDIVWYHNQGNGQWEKVFIEKNLTNVHELFVCDIDQDGKPDILAAGAGMNRVVWYRNEMGALDDWTPQLVEDNFGGARSIAAADIDGDGDIDIAGGASDVHEVSVWMNQGGDPMQWEKSVVSNNFDGSHRVQLVDINQDGRTDILGAAWGVNKLAWWENSGSNPGEWPIHILDNALALAMTALAADLDRDGDPDVIGTGLQGEVSWYENTNGDGTQWKKSIIDQTLAGAWPICAGDLDGDKDLDLVIGGDQGNQIRWYKNTTSGLLNGNMITPYGRYRTGWYLPETYSGDQQYELLIVLPGDPHMRAYQILRDFLIPVSNSRNNLILSIDLPRSQAPYANWDEEGYLQSAIDYATSGFGIDRDRIYVMGFTCQGQAVMRSALSGNIPVRGFIGFNPLIPSLDLGTWTVPHRPIVTAVSDSHPDKNRTSALMGHLNTSQMWMDQIDFSGSVNDYLIPELPDLTIQCLEAIESVYIVGRNDQPFPENHLQIDLINNINMGVQEVVINGRIGDDITMSIINLDGIQVYQSGTIRMATNQYRMSLSREYSQFAAGLYCILARNQLGENASGKIMILN